MEPKKKSEAETNPTEKPGWKSSEFWLLAIVLIIGVLVESDAFGESHWIMKVAALVSQTLGVLGYNAGRAKVKFGGSIERAEEKKAKASSPS